MSTTGVREPVPPEEFIDRALAAPILQRLTPVWGRQPSSVPPRRAGQQQLFFPQWRRHPSSAFRRPAWNHPPASAPAFSVFARRRPLRPPRSR